MTRRNAAPYALAALCTLLLAVLAHCQAPVFAAGRGEPSAGGTSEDADSSPGAPGESDPTDGPGLRGSPADPSRDDPHPLDKPPPSSALTGEGGSAASPVHGAPLRL